jgi:hypothetical protein
VFDKSCPEFKEWVNCFIELEGAHRFKNDPRWGKFLVCFRNGELTEEDIVWVKKEWWTTF